MLWHLHALVFALGAFAATIHSVHSVRENPYIDFGYSDAPDEYAGFHEGYATDTPDEYASFHEGYGNSGLGYDHGYDDLGYDDHGYADDNNYYDDPYLYDNVVHDGYPDDANFGFGETYPDDDYAFSDFDADEDAIYEDLEQREKFDEFSDPFEGGFGFESQPLPEEHPTQTSSYESFYDLYAAYQNAAYAQPPQCSAYVKTRISSLIQSKDCCVNHHVVVGEVLATDKYLFGGECPKQKLPAICPAIADYDDGLLLANGTSIVWREEYNTTYVRKTLATMYAYGSHYGVDHSHDKFHIMPHELSGDVSNGSAPTIFAHQWTSDTAAGVVAVGNTACCFNVFGGVHPGDALSAQCVSPLLGATPEDIVTWLVRVSVLTPGDFRIYVTPTDTAFTLENQVIIGGLTYSDATALMISTSTNLVDFGPFAGVGAAFLGTFLEAVATNPAISQGDVWTVPQNDGFTATNGVIRILSEAEVEQQRALMAASVCSFAHQLAVQPATTTPAFVGAIITITCGDEAICIVDILSSDLQESTMISATTTAATQPIVYVRASGLTDVVLDPFVDNVGTVPITFVFYDAHTVSIYAPGEEEDPPEPIPPLIAPFAVSVYILARENMADMARAVEGPVVMGRTKSLLTIGAGSVDEIIVPPATAIDSLPPPESLVAICDCVCPITDTQYENYYVWRCRNTDYD